jgi:hydrogenase expression/formation protein HypC
MCLGVPGRIIEVDGIKARVDFWGTKRQVLISTVDSCVGPGDYVLVHVGYAIRKIPDEEVERTLEFYNSLLEDPAGDLMAADVKTEIDGTATDGSDDER